MSQGHHTLTLMRMSNLNKTIIQNLSVAPLEIFFTLIIYIYQCMSCTSKADYLQMFPSHHLYCSQNLSFLQLWKYYHLHCKLFFSQHFHPLFHLKSLSQSNLPPCSAYSVM